VDDAGVAAVPNVNQPSKPTAPTVSVLVMTYNHEHLIAQALDSVLTQETAFAYEVLISEDCSTDRTREIVIGYQERHPGKIRLLLSERNLHDNEIVARGLRVARGRYVALLDGDDYWTSPRKLQRQVDFLDTHPECAMCFHNALVVDETHGRPARHWTPNRQKEISTLDDLWHGNFIATCSTMYRNGLIGDVPPWYRSLFPITDWPLHILHAEHGTIGYVDEVMAVYRHHSGGLYSALAESRKLDATAAFYDVMNVNFGRRYESVITRATFRYFYDWAREYARRGDLDAATSCLRRCLARRPPGLAPLVELGTMWLKLQRRRLGRRAMRPEAPASRA
jgi:glycosyltransferase involved in cell wall biosynthesis